MSDLLRAVDPILVEGWLRARSLARGLPQPVPDHGGLRVDTHCPTELRRYVFARPMQGLRELALSISEPDVFIKLCGTEEEMRALLPDKWRIRSTTSWMMIGAAHPDRSAPLPLGYQLQVDTAGATTTAQIVDEVGRIAASGFAAELGDVFVYDRIFTERDHRRKGLGRAIMAALSSARTSARLTGILVATADGRALYTALGWRAYSPYNSADIPSDS
jgi:GNAT superfamily N-acetyltransferase